MEECPFGGGPNCIVGFCAVCDSQNPDEYVPDLNINDLTTEDVVHIVNEPFFKQNPTVQMVRDRYRIGYKSASFLVQIHTLIHQTILKAQRRYTGD